MYRCEKHCVYFFQHGDDFVIGGPREGSLWLMSVLESKFIVKDRDVLGPLGGDLDHFVRLNRTLRWHRADAGEAILRETDARHGALLRAHMRLVAGGRGLSAPGVAVKITPDTEQPMNDEKRGIFRSACVRLSFLALDRADLQFVSKDCSRRGEPPGTALANAKACGALHAGGAASHLGMEAAALAILLGRLQRHGLGRLPSHEA